ncbi:MAG: preprotein translocase subunit SecG [Halieaceae bacterium]
MEQLILVAHLLIAFAIIGLILLQQGKGADMGASFGAGASQTLLGSDGSGNILTRATAILATAFFLTSFGLAIVAKDKSTSTDAIDIPVPLVEQQQPSMESELPVLEDELPPVVSGDADLPEVPENE